MLHEGDKAPEFSLQDDSGKEVSLKSLKGKKVILYFYPKDDTPGCTTEACNFRDLIKEFSKLNAVIYGVSRDTVESHQKFKTKFSLPFPLLADTNEAACKAYEVLVEKNMYGKKSTGIARSTFVIDENGKIEKIYPKVKADEHAGELLTYLRP